MQRHYHGPPGVQKKVKTANTVVHAHTNGSPAFDKKCGECRKQNPLQSNLQVNTFAAAGLVGNETIQ